MLHVVDQDGKIVREAIVASEHVKAAVASSPVKTDRNDARMIANLMRLGWFRPVHCKSLGAQETRARLGAKRPAASLRP